MSLIPDELRVKLAQDYVQQNFESGEPWSMTIARAILVERHRCSEICAAEREWGGSVEDAHKLIESGEPPRKIEGWNAPYEDEE